MVTIYNLKSNFQVILLFEADSPLMHSNDHHGVVYGPLPVKVKKNKIV